MCSSDLIVAMIVLLAVAAGLYYRGATAPVAVETATVSTVDDGVVVTWRML